MSEGFDVYPEDCQRQEKQEVLQNSGKERTLGGGGTGKLGKERARCWGMELADHGGPWLILHIGR